MELYLSVVVASAGGNRLQNFITALLEQCTRYRIPAELIVVGPELAVELSVPAKRGFCTVRAIEVPAGTDEAVAKNAGILRSLGRFVLVANCDNVLSDELMKFISEQQRRLNSLEWNDIAAKDGSLMLGTGWSWKELDGSRPFRWFNNDAEISIQPHREAERVLAIDIEPGPGVRMGPTTLDVLDDEGSKVLSVQLVSRRVVNIPVPNQSAMPVRLRLHVSNGGHRSSNDPRILNARVMRCGLYDAPVSALPWSVPQRIWWMLTRSMGSSLLPDTEPLEKWPDSPYLTASGDVTVLPRERWLERRGYPEAITNVDRGLGTEDLKETVLIERLDPRPQRTASQIAVDLVGMPLVWFFRSIPRPPLPEPGAFANVVALENPLAPLENPPRICIVTPSYQQGRFLEWTMRSVLEQDYPNLEYVVMDGGSKDETGEILARYRDRVTYCESAPDKGQADAVVRGFAHTNGEIMAYLNSDDVLAPGALDFAARFFAAHPEVDAVYSHRVFIDESNIVTRYWILPPHHTWMMQRWDYIPQETCFWRRRIYEKVGGIDPSFQFALDYDLFVRFMEQGRMERANRFLGAFREHSSSKTVNQEGAHPEVERVYQERGIRVRPWHRLPQLAQFELLDVRSSRFAARGKILPGAMPGIGYNYDLVWGGRLNGPRSSSRNNSGIHRT